jgi:hypothetical protein
MRYEFVDRNREDELDITLLREQTSVGLRYRNSFGIVEGAIGCELLTSNRSLIPAVEAEIGLWLPDLPVTHIYAIASGQPMPGSCQFEYSGANLTFPYVVGGLSATVGSDTRWGELLAGSVEYGWTIGHPFRAGGLYAYTDSLKSSRLKLSLQSQFLPSPVSATYRYYSLTNNPDLTLDGLTFSHSSMKGAEFHILDLVVERPPVLGASGSIFGGYATGHGRIVGNIQSWPFLEVLETVIENRVNYRLTGDVQLWYAGMEYSWNWANARFSPSVFVYDVRPNMRIESWQPEFLVFGFKNYSESVLDIRRITLGRVQLSYQMDFPIASFTITANQMFPIFTARRTEVAGATSGVPSGGFQTRSDGGRWFMISIVKKFS